MNYTTPIQAFDINNASTFNPGCYNEINTIIERCTNFKINIISQMNLHFLISVVLLCILVLYQIQAKHNPFKFQQTEFYKNKIDYRVDFIISILLIFDIVFIFLM